MTRTEVYKIIDGERDYQDEKWGGRNHGKTHDLESWIFYMEYFLGQTKEILSTELYTTSYPKAMEFIRKVTALGVACMENYDCPPREVK